MDEGGASVTAMATREVVLSRVFDAPRERVFAVWTEPAHVRRWWGPKEFSSPKVVFELRPGGRILLGMRSPDGAESWNEGVVREVKVPERLVYSMFFSDAKGTRLAPAAYGLPGTWPDELLVTVTFETVGAGTRVTLRQSGIPDEWRDMTAAGWTQSLEKLEEVLEDLKVAAGAKRELTLTRVLDAPLDLVWDACTKPEHLVRWMSAKTWETPSADVDPRPGGHFKIKMRPQDRSEEGFMFDGTYAEVRRPERLVMRVGDGRLVTITLGDAGAGKTKITFVIEMAMSEEQERQGWTEILDKLEAHAGRMK